MVKRQIFSQIGNLLLYIYSALYTSKPSFYKNVNFGSVALILYLKKEFEIYHFRCSATQNFIRRSTMVADIFEDFDRPSKKFLATSLEKYRYTI